jgi:ribulose-5-phosphate 4-epimerase/fuculose-1-phosphate aldolase
MNPAGLGWNEITASSLITVDIFRNIITKSDLSLGKSGQSFHTIIQRDRSDLQCIFHIHPVNGVVVSTIKNHGLLTVGRTIGEAFTLMQRLIKACDVQIQLLATGVGNMPIPHKIAELTSQQL